MRKIHYLSSLFLFAVILFCGCSKESNVQPNITVFNPDEMECTASSTINLSFTSTKSWTATVSAGSDWLKISKNSGAGDETGKQSISLSALSDNNTNALRNATVTLTSGSVVKSISIVQHPAFIFEKTEYQVGVDGGTVTIIFECDGNAKEGEVEALGFGDIVKMAPSAFTDNSQNQTRGLAYKWTMSIPVVKNESKSQLIGYVQFIYKGIESEVISICQDGNNVSQDVDSKNDGIVKKLYTHSKGAGVPVILLGDGFQNSDVTSGTFDQVMDQAMKHYFSIEPMTSHKEYFDIYSVSAVSKDAAFGSNYSTAFSCIFGEGTLITGDDEKCMEYAQKALSNKEQLNDALIIVVLNSDRYAGTCSMYYMDKASDFPSGVSVAYVPITDGMKYAGIGFEQVLHHEANGHGFGKLGDEYGGQGTAGSDDIKELEKAHTYAIDMNVDVKADVTKSIWSKLAADPLYADEKLGCYEGAYTYDKGFYRPTETSIMVDNSGYFNAPSREAIYKRIFYIANNHNYTYNYNDFTTYDVVNRTKQTKASLSKYSESHLPPLSAPRKIMIKH